MIINAQEVANRGADFFNGLPKGQLETSDLIERAKTWEGPGLITARQIKQAEMDPEDIVVFLQSADLIVERVEVAIPTETFFIGILFAKTTEELQAGNVAMIEYAQMQ